MKAYRVFRIDPMQPSPVMESSAYELRERAEGDLRMCEMRAQHYGWDPPISFEIREEELPATWHTSNGKPIRMCFVLLGQDDEQTDLDIGGKRCGVWIEAGWCCALIRGHKGGHAKETP